MKGWKKILHENGNKSAGVTKLTSDKIDFQTKAVTREKQGNLILIKRT